MILIVIFFSIIQQTSTQSCLKGCIRCVNTTCQICDIQSFFFLRNQTCTFYTKLNCKIIDNSGNCLICNPGYFIDQNTQNCVAISQTLTNCQIPILSTICDICQTNFYNIGGVCNPVKVLVPNCAIYTSDGICSQCNSSYVVQYDYKSCVKKSVDLQNCLFLSPINCSACVNGYFLNRNYFVNQLFSNPNTPNTRIFDILLTQTNNHSFISSINVCQQNTVVCLTYLNASTCLTCPSGFYLNSNGICLPYPQQMIPNCLQYLTLNTCQNCVNGFFLLTLNFCSQNIPVQNCITYSQNSTTTTCLSCSTGFYVSSPIQCSSRNNSKINACSVLSLNQDACSLCNPNLILTNDFLACLPMIQNCQTYSYSTSITTQLNCQICMNNNYLTQNTCVLGNISNCLTYSSATECSLCSPLYYLFQGQCQAHNQTLNCISYSTNVANICNQCSISYFPFTFINNCLPIIPIPNCLLYISPSVCQNCINGYNLSSNICSKNTILNCSTQVSNLCTQCYINFILYNGTCMSPLSLDITYSVQNNLQGTQGYSQFNFRNCEIYSLPLNYFSHFGCFEIPIIIGLGKTIISNCKQIDNNYNCIGCSPGYFLSQNQCVSSCDPNNNSYLIVMNNVVDQIYQINSFYCDNLTNTNNCQFNTSENQPGASGTIKCLSCKGGFYSLINILPATLNSIPFQDYDPTSFNLPNLTPVSFYPNVSCIPSSSIQNGVIENCRYYMIDSVTSKTVCLTCIFGFQGFSQNIQNGISLCLPMNDCTLVNTPGLSRNLNAIFSCHNCVDSSAIPYAFVRAGSTYTQINGIGNYNVRSVPMNTGTGGGTVACYTQISLKTYIPSLLLPANCGIGITNIEAAVLDASHSNLIQSVNLQKIAAFCAACQPGYYPVPSGSNTVPMVGQCLKIQNCKFSSWFNFCSQCNTNFVYQYNQGVDYTQCFQFTDPNCYAATNIGCVYCNPGYSLNIDQICEILISPRCNSFYYASYENNLALKSINMPTIQYLKPFQNGCLSCQYNFISQLIKTQKFVCTNSSYLKTNLISSTKLILNCVNYSVTNNILTCYQCNQNYIMSLNNNACFSNTSINNCLIANSATICQTCIQNYVLVNGVCQIQNLPNCDKYSSGTTNQICTSCIPGYYLSNNLCLAGLIQNCSLFGSSPTICLSCFNSYILISTKNSGSYCYRLDPNLNCLAYSIDAFNSGQLNCGSCNVGFVVVMVPQTQMTCSQFGIITGCLSYDISTTISSSSFLCSNCSKQYFLQSGFCIIRQKIDPNCQINSPNSDNCQICKSLYYFDLISNSCIPNPTGVVNCRIYSDSVNCVGCQNNFFLLNNTCYPVPLQNLLPNCIYYLDAQNCTVCDKGFFYSNKTCTSMQAANCTTASSPTVCSTCSQGQITQIADGVTNCVNIPDQNCISYSQNQPFTCYGCSQNYYLNNGVCATITQQIIGCLFYDSPILCKICDRAFILAIDRTSCIAVDQSRIDPNCLRTNLVSNGNCLICQPGYFFNGTCQSCSASNCLFCDTTNSSICNICVSGFYMNEQLMCVPWPVVLNVSNNTNITKFGERISVFIVFLI